MRALRLGDDIDDHCIKCKRVTNHVIVSLLEEDPAKVRCRSCYHEHYYLREEAPPKKTAAKKTAAKQAAPEAKTESPEG